MIVSDSFGRAWRLGQAEVAIGCAGIAPLDDWRGRADASGRELEATLIAIADEAAAAADLVRDKSSRVPAAIIRGLERYVTPEDGPAPPPSAAPERGPVPLRSVPVGVDVFTFSSTSGRRPNRSPKKLSATPTGTAARNPQHARL